MQKNIDLFYNYRIKKEQNVVVIVRRRSPMFHRIKKSTLPKTYDPARQRPALRCSICTGEQVAGFKNLSDGKFEEVMLIRNEADLQAFREQYGITGDIEKIY